MSRRTRPQEGTFEQIISVEEADIDQLGHVNNTVYLRWVQDVAVGHWQALATPAEQAAWVWVVARHEIDYKHPAVLGDQVVALTWVGIAQKLFFERHTEILRTRDRIVLARARTLWCPIDVQSGRPCRIPAEMKARLAIPAES